MSRAINNYLDRERPVSGDDMSEPKSSPELLEMFTRHPREPLDLDAYWHAPGGTGDQAAAWEDKPHRLVYDLIGEVVRLRAIAEERDRLKGLLHEAEVRKRADLWT